MTTKLYIVRHCEAEGNLYRRCHGHCDGLLTENGKAQRARLEQYFKDLPVDRVFSSDLSRAVATALSVARPKGLPVETRAELREMKLGAWEDMPWGEVAERYAMQYEHFSNSPHLFSLPDAENAAQAQARLYAALRAVAEECRGRTAVVVSHGLAIRLTMARLLGYPPEQIGEVTHFDNASVSLVEWEDAPAVLFRGHNEHLGTLSTFAKQSWWRKDAAHKEVNLRFAPAALPEDAEAAASMQAQAWKTVYGSLDGFHGAAMLNNALRVSAADPQNVMFALYKGERVGLLTLDPHQEQDSPSGHISLLYLREDLCGRGLGVQLLGQAVSHYRKQGKTALRLRVAPSNLRARRFYEKHGFRPDGQEDAPGGTLLILRKSIVWDNEMEYA